jgi:hypothetical protein
MAKTLKQQVPTEIVNNGVSNEDILWCHKMLSATGFTDEIKEKVSHIYKELFNEELVYSCCKNRGFIKLDYYVRNVLKLL